MIEGRAGDEKTVVLRAGGDGNTHYRLRDELFQSLYADVGGLTSRFEPCLLFVNGSIWGIYNIRERIDQQYLHWHFGEDRFDLLVHGMDRDHQAVICGDTHHWKTTVAFFLREDLAKDHVFQKATELVDITNITDYWLYCIYAANMDWPHSNIYFFKNHDEPSGRWRWISWDADATFDLNGQGLYHDTLAWATRSRLRHDLRYNHQKGLKDNMLLVESTLIVRRLLENQAYRRSFVTRFCDLLNSHLRPERVEARLEQIIALSNNDLPKDWQRWGRTEEGFRDYVAQIRNFIDHRPERLVSDFSKKFQLGEMVSIQLHCLPPAGGTIHINTVVPEAMPWRGKYFPNSIVQLTAVPSLGYQFVGWTEPTLAHSVDAQIVLQRVSEIGARFRPADEMIHRDFKVSAAGESRP